MTQLSDGEELSIDIPEGGGACFAFPPALASPPSTACPAVGPEGLAQAAPGRLVAAGTVHLEGGDGPARFVLRFVPDANAVEPTADTARDFAAEEASHYAPQATSDGAEGGPGDAAPVGIVAVGTSPATGPLTSDLVALGSLHAVRASFVVDLRESGRDVPVHVASYGAWAREGLYVLSVEGEAFHGAAVDAFADQAARTLTLKDPAPPAPSDLARIGARVGQAGLVILVLVAVVFAVLGARTRRLGE